MTALARVLSSRSNRNTIAYLSARSSTVEQNIKTLRSFGPTRFVMIEMGSRP